MAASRLTGVPMKTAVTWIGFLLGAGALVLQFYVTLSLKLGQGESLAGTLVFLFTFYTILTNIMLVLVYLSDLTTAGWLGWWRSPVTRGMMAGAIVLVTLVVHFLLANLQELTGLASLCDTLLHYVAPALYVLWWILFEPKGKLKLGNLPIMLLPTLIWLVWAMVRGAVIDQYPYPILNATTLGYPVVALNCVLIFVGLLVIYLIVLGLDRVLAGKLPKST